MNIADTLRGLLRRWYIVFPGLILAVVLAVGSFFVIKPGYERSATQLLLPGAGTVPEGATNPFLFLGSLAQTADIMVRAMGSEEVTGEVVERYPGIDVEVKRDPLVSGPVIQFTVTAANDADAAGAIDLLLSRSADTLDRLQSEQDVRQSDRITSSTLTKDNRSTLQQKTRLTVSAGVGVAVVILVLLVASLVDGLSRRGRPNGRKGNRLPPTSSENAPEDAPPDDPGTEGADGTPPEQADGTPDVLEVPEEEPASSERSMKFEIAELLDVMAPDEVGVSGPNRKRPRRRGDADHPASD